MNQCQYSFERAGPPLTSAGAILIALHAKGENLSNLAPLLALANPGLAVYGVESNRPSRILPRSDRAWQADDIGRVWFLEHETGDIEPATFGDALAQIELFLIDTMKNEAGPGSQSPQVFFYGKGQGATIALTLLTLHPQHVFGVISLDGYLPVIPNAFDLLPRLSDHVDVSLNYGFSPSRIPDGHIQTTVEAFRQSACRLTLDDLNSGSEFPGCKIPSLLDGMRTRIRQPIS